MKIIKTICPKDCEHLREELYDKASWFANNYMYKRPIGKYHGLKWYKTNENHRTEYELFVYQSEKEIVAEIRKIR